MDPLSLATACYAVISSCVKVSRRLNQLIEDSKCIDELIIESLNQTHCLHRVLKAINSTLINNANATSFLATDSDAGALREAILQAIKGSASAIATFENILTGVLPSPRALGLARKAWASQRLQQRANELLHVRQQMQTYTGILQMALQTVTVSLLMRDVGPVPANPAKLTSKVSRLLRSIHSAEQRLALPLTDHLDPAQVEQFGRCTQSAHAIASTASSVLEQTQSVSGKASKQTGDDDVGSWGFTFLESDSTDPPMVHVNLVAVDSRSRIEAWITQRPPSDATDSESGHVKSSAPPSRPQEEAWLLPATAPQSEICQDDSVSFISSNDSLNLDAGLSRIFLELGEQSLAEDHFPQAETYFRKALDKLRNSSSPHDLQDIEQKIGVCCLEQGKYEDATAIFDKYPDLVRSVIERIFIKAQSFYSRGEYQCANNCLRRPLANPRDTPSHIVRGMRMLSGQAFLALDKLDEAETQLLLILLPPDQPGDSRSFEAHHSLACLHLKRANIDQAIIHARTASDGRWRLFGRQHDASQESLALLVDVCKAKGDTEEAEACSKLLTEENLKNRRTQSRLTLLRNRVSRLYKQDQFTNVSDSDSFSEELEQFLVDHLTSREDSVDPTEDHETLLLKATQERRSAIVRLLLRDGDTNIQARDELGNTALHHAVYLGFEEIVSFLLTQIGDGVNLANRAGETALTIATRNQDDTILRLLLKSKKLALNKEVHKKVDSKVVSHGPALHIAVIDQSEPIVDLFMRKAPRININRPDAQGKTPLHYALMSGNAKISELLLTRPGIDINRVTEPEKQSALSLAISKDLDEIALRLISSREVDVNSRDNQGHSAIHHSAWCNKPEIMALLLLRKSIDINAKDLCGRTALHIAAMYGNVKLVKLLIADKRIDSNCTTKHGETPEAAALSANHQEAALLLEGHAITYRLQQYGF